MRALAGQFYAMCLTPHMHVSHLTVNDPLKECIQDQFSCFLPCNCSIHPRNTSSVHLSGLFILSLMQGLYSQCVRVVKKCGRSLPLIGPRQSVSFHSVCLACDEEEASPAFVQAEGVCSPPWTGGKVEALPSPLAFHFLMLLWLRISLGQTHPLQHGVSQCRTIAELLSLFLFSCHVIKR